MGGAQALLAGLCCSAVPGSLPACSHAIVALHGKGDGPYADQFATARIPVSYLARSRFALPFIIARLISVLVRKKFDIVHLHLRVSSIAGTLLCRALRRGPVVVSIYEARHQAPRLFDVIFPIVARLADRVITSFPSTVERLKSAGIPMAKMNFIQQTVDLTGATTDHDRCRADLCSRYGIDPGRPLLLSLARLNKDRRIATIVDAMQQIARTRPDVLLLMIGDGPERIPLERMVAACHIERNVIFGGGRTDRWKVLPGCDIYLTCSDNAIPGIAAIEAMACGRPTVAHNLNPMDEREQRSEQFGSFIVARDASAVADAVVALLDNPEKLLALGERARNLVTTQWSIADYVKAHELVYCSIFPGKPDSPPVPSHVLSQR